MMNGSVVINIRNGQVETFLNADGYELEVLLEPVLDEVQIIVEEALAPIETDELVANVTR